MRTGKESTNLKHLVADLSLEVYHLIKTAKTT